MVSMTTTSWISLGVLAVIIVALIVVVAYSNRKTDDLEGIRGVLPPVDLDEGEDNNY